MHNHWDALDQFEGEEYQRTLAAITLDSGEQVDAFVYALNAIP
ncbi:gamma-glutamylcyclotransferase [Pseudomonas sp. OIL-1]|nr:gamma-glutamylcyclotransferase [Pseudomonas sp. OIL-1]